MKIHSSAKNVEEHLHRRRTWQNTWISTQMLRDMCVIYAAKPTHNPAVCQDTKKPNMMLLLLTEETQDALTDISYLFTEDVCTRAKIE